jgi:hypothetical protein
MTVSTSTDIRQVYHPTNRIVLLICSIANILIVAYLLSTMINRVVTVGAPIQLSDFSVVIPFIAGIACFALAMSSKIVITPGKKVGLRGMSKKD